MKRLHGNVADEAWLVMDEAEKLPEIRSTVLCCDGVRAFEQAIEEGIPEGKRWILLRLKNDEKESSDAEETVSGITAAGTEEAEIKENGGESEAWLAERLKRFAVRYGAGAVDGAAVGAIDGAAVGTSGGADDEKAVGSVGIITDMEPSRLPKLPGIPVVCIKDAVCGMTKPFYLIRDYDTVSVDGENGSLYLYAADLELVYRQCQQREIAQAPFQQPWGRR